MHSLTRRLVRAAAGAMLAAAILPVSAQPYPAKPVRMIVPFPPGGPVDTTARVLGQKLSEQWGQPVVVDNRPGANGSLGADLAAKAPADGYTVFVNSIHHSVLPSLMPKLPYDIQKDFAPVSFAAQFAVFLVAHPSVPFKSVNELIAYAKSNPGKLAYASAGSGGGTHLAGELFKMQTGVDLLQVPYKGSAPAMTDLLGGQVQIMFSDGPTAAQHMKKGSIRVLGVASPQRSAVMPETPTISESGVKGYEAYSWAGIMVPAGTPKAVIASLNAAIVTALNNPDVKQRMLGIGAEAAPSTPEQYGKFFQAEMAKWSKLVKEANIRID
ncbi:MAG: tripartite tricarboxylate transporter substrate binding protein [Noviherbaspirillum sp.]